MKWWWDMQPCCLLFSYCLRSCCAFMEQLARIFLQITLNNKSSSIFFFSWAEQEKLTFKKVNEPQTSNCVSGGKFQDFGYLIKILSLDSFPMWCQNGRRVNVWTVYWRPRSVSLCVCARVCVLACVSSAQVSAGLFSYRGHTYLNLYVSSLAYSCPSARERAMAYSLPFTVWQTWTEENGRQKVRKKAGKAQGHKVWRCKWSIKCILGKLFYFYPVYSL